MWRRGSRGKGESFIRAFRKPVGIGSCVFPVPQGAHYTVKLSVLKPDAPFPPDPKKRSQWIDFEKQAELPWDIALAPKDSATRARDLYQTSKILGEARDVYYQGILKNKAAMQHYTNQIDEITPDTMELLFDWF